MSGAWERNPIDILVATPVSGNDAIYYEWYDHVRNIWFNIPAGLKVVHVRFPEPCIDIVRDKAINVAHQNGARWLFFLDADVIPPADVIPRLLAHNKPIVSGLYVRRHNPPFNEMLRFNNAGMVAGLSPIQDGTYQDGSLVECDAVGTGCVLIDMEVFEKVKPRQMVLDGQQCRPQWFVWTEWRQHPGASEDFAFFMHCRKHGIPVFCDTSIKCKHIGPVKFIHGGNNQMSVEFIGENR